MRALIYLVTLLVSFVLTACGGGGGSPGLSSGSASTFTVLAPSAVTLQVGSLQQYSIKGGVKPYTVYSSDPGVAMGWVGGDDYVYVGTVVAGKATVTIADSKNTKFDMIVTAGSSMPFYMTAASAITITPGVSRAQTYTLGGGTPPYVATSSFPSVATVTVNGNQMTITGVQISGTGSNITIRDAAGATLSVAVTVGTVPLAVIPTDATIFTGSIMRAVITGGTPPYRTIMLDNCLIDAKIVQGNILEAKGNKACSGSILTVLDANNQAVSSTVTVNLGTSAIQVAPSALSIPEDPNTPDIPLTIYGANDGQILVFTTNNTVLAPKATVLTPSNKNADGTYTVTLSGGNTCYSPATAAFAGIDYTNPPDGDFDDKAASPPTSAQPLDDIPPRAAQPAVPAGSGVPITITVIDSSGRQGTSTVTVVDNGKGGSGGSCN